jgi:hypothetical protein
MTAQLIVGQPIKSTRLPRFYEPSIHRTLALSKVSATCSSRAGPAPAELCVRAHVARLQTCAARRKHAQQRSNERPEPCLARTSTVRTAPIACRRTTHDKTAPAAHRTMVSWCPDACTSPVTTGASARFAHRGSVARFTDRPHRPASSRGCPARATTSLRAQAPPGEAWCSHPMRPSRSQTSRGCCQTGLGPCPRAGRAHPDALLATLTTSSHRSPRHR